MTLDLWTPSTELWELDITPPSGAALPADSADEVALVATELRKKRVELNLKDLGSKDQLRFAVAKHKKLKAWLHHKTVRKVSQAKIPEHALMRCRWLLSWKTPTGDEPPEDLNDQGKKAKARLIVIGYEDPDIDTVANDAPTLSKDGRNIVLQCVASYRWELVSFDVSTAFLHGQGDGRLLGLRPVPEMRDALNMGPTDQCALIGGAYGRIDAPYLWFCRFRDELLKQGCVQSPLDPCVFGFYEQDQQGRRRLHGCLGIHVDDGIAGGDDKFLGMLKRVEARFKFGAYETKEFTYTGIHFKQWHDGSIEYDQKQYVEKIKPIEILKSRKAEPKALVSDDERSRYRSLIGALQYAAVHSRPDLAAKVGELQSRVNCCTVEDLSVANRVLAEAKQFPMSLMVLPIAVSEVTFCAFSDASFSSVKERAAHQGTLVFVTTPQLLENHWTAVARIAWVSKRLERVVRSTLGAEAAALSNSVDRLMWLRIFWAWMNNPDIEWAKPEKVLASENQGALVTDCRSAYDLLTRTAVPQCSEHRTTLECLLIRERLRENCVVRWVASPAMLSDCLTKSMDAGVLRECIRSGRYSLQDENRVLQSRADHRKRLAWIKGHGNPDSAGPVPAELAMTTTGVADRNSKGALHDFWTFGQKGELVKVHQVPRTARFTPIGDISCPVDLRRFQPVRITCRDGETRSEQDFWTGNQHSGGATSPWTGRTIFLLHSAISQNQDSTGCVKSP